MLIVGLNLLREQILVDILQINVAEGKKQSRILASEAVKLEQINNAQGRAEGLTILSEALTHQQGEFLAALFKDAVYALLLGCYFLPLCIF